MNARTNVPKEAKETLLLSAEKMEGLRITGTVYEPFTNS